ncbi:MAG: MFS transporter [Flavobacteriaceae bacterium]|nr:MFS transporter [Flavobacteriaceae bacterium]
MNKQTSKKYISIILLVFAIFFVISFITNILNSIMADVKASFDLSLLYTGLLPFSFFIAYGVMSVPAGFLSERYSDKKLLGLSFLIIALASIIFILFPSYLIFGFSLFIMGCSMAVLQVIINPLLRIAGGEAHFAFNSVLAQLVFGGASFLSPYLYMALVNKNNQQSVAELLRSFVPENLPWVSLYIVFALTAGVMFLVISFVNYPDYAKKEDERSGGIRNYIDLLKNKWAILYFLGIFCYVGIEQGIGNWISQFLLEYHGMDAQTIGASTVSRFWAMLTIGCLLGLLLLKLMDSRYVLIGSTLATTIALIVALTGSSEVSVKAFPWIGFFISVMWSIIFSLGLNSVKSHHGALSGILCTGIAGGAIMPLIVGAIGDSVNLKTGLFFLAVPLLYILSIGFWAKPLVKNKTISITKKES